MDAVYIYGNKISSATTNFVEDVFCGENYLFISHNRNLNDLISVLDYIFIGKYMFKIFRE